MELHVMAIGLGVLGLGGWTAWELYRVFQPLEAPVRFPSMVRRLGLSIDDMIDSDLGYHIQTARRLCLHCDCLEDCDAWMRSHETAADAPHFCPNAAYLHLAKYPPGAVE